MYIYSVHQPHDNQRRPTWMKTNDDHRRPQQPTQATTTNAGQRGPTTVNAGQRRPTKAHRPTLDI